MVVCLGQDRLDISLEQSGFGVADGYWLKLLYMSHRYLGPCRLLNKLLPSRINRCIPALNQWCGRLLRMALSAYGVRCACDFLKATLDLRWGQRCRRWCAAPGSSSIDPEYLRVCCYLRVCRLVLL